MREKKGKKFSEFEKKVFEACKKIPRGKTATYGEIAERIGKPRAYRAVGNALNKNRNPKVPCHRIIRSDGTAGGYAKGKKKKIGILKKEGAKMPEQKRTRGESNPRPSA